MNLKASALRTILFICLLPVFVFAQGGKASGTVAANLVEFKIPLEQPADGQWSWNRAETPDNDCEYMWQVAVPDGNGRYSFGFYLYKAPGSKPSHGEMPALFKAGQASVFREDAQGKGSLLESAEVKVSAENGNIVLRMTDADLIKKIFGEHPKTATINARGIGSIYEVVNIEYADTQATQQ